MSLSKEVCVRTVFALQVGQVGPQQTPLSRWYGVDKGGQAAPLPHQFPSKLDIIKWSEDDRVFGIWVCVRCALPATNGGHCKECWLHLQVVEHDLKYKWCYALMDREWDMPVVPTGTGRHAVVLSAALSAAAIAVRSAKSPAVAVKVAIRMYNDLLLDGVTWESVVRGILLVLVGGDHRRYDEYISAAPADAPETRLPGTIVRNYDAAASHAAGAPQFSLYVDGPPSDRFLVPGTTVFTEYDGVRMTVPQFEANPVDSGQFAMEMSDGTVICAHSLKDHPDPNAGQMDTSDAYMPPNNCKLCPATGHVVTTRSVYGGAKLTLDYGKKYWHHLPHTLYIRGEIVFHRGKPCEVKTTNPDLRDLFISLKDVETGDCFLASVKDVSFPDPTDVVGSRVLAPVKDVSFPAAVVGPRKRRGGGPPANPRTKEAKSAAIAPMSLVQTLQVEITRLKALLREKSAEALQVEITRLKALLREGDE
jgi:hypothetical protein